MSIALQHSPADIIRWVLIALGQGTNPDNDGLWPIYTAGEPPSPDEVITTYDTTSQSDGRSMIDGESLLHYGIQVRVRSTTHKVGFAKANAVRTALDESLYQRSVILDGQHYLLHCAARTSLMSIGKETPTSKRTIFTINCLVTIRPT